MAGAEFVVRRVGASWSAYLGDFPGIMSRPRPPLSYERLARNGSAGKLTRRVMYGYIMLRTQISLTVEERRALDLVSARTGRSISSLIREAVETVYGMERSASDDLLTMRAAFGSWRDRDIDGAEWVDQVRSGTRLRQEP